jgi:two-component system sensor histidine kinase KdpD
MLQTDSDLPSTLTPNHQGSLSPARFERPPPRRELSARVLAVLYASSYVAIALVVGLTIENVLHVQNALLVFLPVVLLAATRYGFWMASWVSLLSVLGSSYMLAAPRLSFAVADVENVWALGIFLIAAALTSSLAAQSRARAAAADYHRRVVEQLYALSSSLGAITDPLRLGDEIAAQTSAILQMPTSLLERDSAGAWRVHSGGRPSPALDAAATAAAEVCWRERRPAGAGTETHPQSSWHFWPLETAHGIVGLLGVHSRDIEGLPHADRRLRESMDDQVALQLERARLVEDMRHAEVLAETEKLRSALLTSISHDLRTPLASILGNVTSLREYGHLYDDATRAEMLEMAEAETRRLARFVDNLLHMTRIDAGALHPSFDKIDLGEVIGSALQRLGKTLCEHQVVVDVPGEGPMVPVDFALAEQVLVNLLDNAAKYSPPGSTITVAVRASDTAIALRVSDEGPGVPDADLTRIFERFFRVRVADHRPAGTGLGLAICKGFVEAMGGTIAAANRDDRRGTVLTVTWPLERPAAPRP